MARKEPQNLDAEISVLGCGFLDKEALDKIMDEVTDDMFYSDANRLIYKSMKDLHTNGIPVEINTVCNELDKSKSLAKVGGVEYITEIINSVPSTANLNYYIKIIHEKAVLRNLIKKATKIQEDCYEEADSVENIVENAEKNILGVYNDRLGKDMKKVSEVLPDIQEYIETLVAAKGDISGVKTGYYDFDKLTNGLKPRQVIIIAARPARGKSTFAIDIALNAAIHDKKSVAFFSLEMGVEEIMMRAFSYVGRIEGEVLSKGRLSSSDWKKWNEAMSELSDAKIYIDASGDNTVSEIRRKCRKLKNSEDGLDMVIIDYLQLLNSSSKYAGQRVQEVGELSRDIKKMAMELEVPVIALSQLSRGIENRKGEDAKPRLADLRESGSIEQDADIVLFIHCEDKYVYSPEKNIPIELLIAKNRAGATGSVNLVFRRNISSFDNYVNKEEENE